MAGREQASGQCECTTTEDKIASDKTSKTERQEELEHRGRQISQKTMWRAESNAQLRQNVNSIQS